MSLPRGERLGLGLGYRSQLHDYICDHTLVAWIEVIAEHFMSRPEGVEFLRAAFRDKAIICHGLELSIGTVGDDEDFKRHAEGLMNLAAELDSPWFSDHLCFTRTSAHTEIANLTPLPCTREAADHVARRVRWLQRTAGRPFLLENISYHFSWGAGEMTEAEFITKILEQGDCGMLLDLTNLHNNATNHRFDPLEVLEVLPLERVRQIHLAGGHEADGFLHDSHSFPVPDAVWRLLERVMAAVPNAAVMIERDGRLEDTQEISRDLERAARLTGWVPTERAG